MFPETSENRVMAPEETTLFPSDESRDRSPDGTESHGHSPFLEFHTDSYLILPYWSTSTILGLVCAMVAAVFTSIGYECIKEYLRYVHHKAKLAVDSAHCCGVPVFSCRQKLALSCLHLINIVMGYFMMMCVMTMNIWLLIAVVVGASVGYSIGKPLIANASNDSFTAHDYQVTHAHTENPPSRRASQRSGSWHYQPINKRRMQAKLTEETFTDADDLYKETERTTFLNTEDSSTDKAEVIWVRRDNFETIQKPQQQSSGTESAEADAASCSTSPTLSSKSAQSPRTGSRFKSTSKLINDSFRSTGSGSVRKSDSIQSTCEQSQRSASAEQNSQKQPKRSSSRTSTQSLSRFKPVSREIMRQQTLTRDPV